MPVGFSTFYDLGDDDWANSSSSSSPNESNHENENQSMEEEESIKEVIVELSPCDEIKRIEEEMDILLKKDPRFLAFKQFTLEDLQKVRYEIKKENPELSKIVFSRKNVLGHVWPNLLVGAFNSIAKKNSNIATDDRCDDKDFTLSINSIPNEEPKSEKHLHKHKKVLNKKKHEHRRKAAEEEKKEEIRKRGENIPVDEVGEMYLEKYRGYRGEKVGVEINGSIDDITYRRMERVLWYQKINKAKPILPLPSLLKKYHVVTKKENARILGPGSYDPTNYYDIQHKKQVNRTKGVMNSPTTRFPYDAESKTTQRAATPQFQFRNPFIALEDANDRYKHPCKRTLFEGGRRCFRKTETVGAPLGPGSYELKSPLQEFLNKKVSEKGPYNVFSEPRDKIMHGYNKTPKTNEKLGPGCHFDFDKETQNYRLNTRWTHFKGKFSKPLPDDLDFQTGERNSVFTPFWPRSSTAKLPGPGTYDYVQQNLGMNHTKNKYPFNSSTDQRPRFIWTDETEVNPTRYRLRRSFKLLYNIPGKGMKSAFKNKAAARLPFKQFPEVTERLRGKDIPIEELFRRADH